MSNLNNAILFAYQLDQCGAALAIKEQSQLDSSQLSEEITWLHIDGANAKAQGWMQKKLAFLDPVIINSLLAEETRPRLEKIDNSILLVLRGVNLNKDSEPEDMVSIRFWISKANIITVIRRPIKAIDDIKSKLEQGIGPKNSGDFLYQLTSSLFQRIEPSLNLLEEVCDDSEELLAEEGSSNEIRERVGSIRKQTIKFRRYMAPQKEVIGQLCKIDALPWLLEEHKLHLQESYHVITRYVEYLDVIRDRCQIIKDEISGQLADKLNRNMYLLSIISAIFLPLGFLTGLLGINVGGIPGADNPEAFLIFGGILVGLVCCQVLIFRALKWF